MSLSMFAARRVLTGSRGRVALYATHAPSASATAQPTVPSSTYDMEEDRKWLDKTLARPVITDFALHSAI